jgi:hypothetical protein
VDGGMAAAAIDGERLGGRPFPGRGRGGVGLGGAGEKEKVGWAVRVEWVGVSFVFFSFPFFLFFSLISFSNFYSKFFLNQLLNHTINQKPMHST